MKNIAIICEYNPFHNGHEYQINAIKKKYPDSRIVCIMSGNYTQRAEPAVYDKYTRARTAIMGGADLVLELPFPYSSAGAEYFASAGVHIADSLGCIDMLSFGSECGDTEKIVQTAKNLLSDDFNDALDTVTSDKSQSYAALREKVYAELYGDASILREPNNILALEYVKALIKKNSSIRPITLRREGNAYNDTKIDPCAYPSASALRALIRDGGRDKLSSYMPKEAAKLLSMCDSADIGLLERGVIARLRLDLPDSIENIAEASGGLGRRIYDAAKEASTFEELFSLAATKKYTNARIRRVLLNYIIGVREGDIKTMPTYTQLLASNEKGREILKSAKKNFCIFTKPADYKNAPHDTLSQAELSHKADSIYPLMLKKGGTAYENIIATPYIE